MKLRKKLKYLFAIGVLLFGSIPIIRFSNAVAESCPELRIVFARGSGGILNEDPNYLEFKETIETKLLTTSIDYEFIDLAYPAVGVGMDNFWVTLGALASGGEAYTFGESVNTGVSMLSDMVNNSCKNTKYVIGGYSQGAMVVSKALHSINPENLIYAATFGDPKIYLPEGEGIFPIACREENLSDYRAYVPDCHAYEGLLGSYQPYEPEGFEGKVGTWCNTADLFCSSHWNLDQHLSYISDNLYEDASRIIYDKITDSFHIENMITSPHDTAILIDSTGSMAGMIEKYQTEAIRLARETLESGGRVALYDYRDLSDPYTPVEHCNFETCTLSRFIQEINNIEVDGGGDAPESLLSASLTVMRSLNWQYGATKSVVVLTDTWYHSPDLDGTTLADVVNLSKSIDPVNFYVITTSGYTYDHQELAEATGGKVVSIYDNLSLLTDEIIDRYDSLPRVEAGKSVVDTPPYFNLIKNEQINDTTAKITFDTNAEKTYLFLNDGIIGYTTEKEIIITDLDPSQENIIRLIPVIFSTKGNPVDITIPKTQTETLIPKAPKTGLHLD